MVWYAVYWCQNNETTCFPPSLPPSLYPLPPLLSRDLPLSYGGRGILRCQRQPQYHPAVQIQLRAMLGTNSTVLRDHLEDVIVCCYITAESDFRL